MRIAAGIKQGMPARLFTPAASSSRCACGCLIYCQALANGVNGIYATNGLELVVGA